MIPEDALIHLIYSADILGETREIEGMGPFRKVPEHGAYATPMPGEWAETEGDEQYDLGYLGDESGDATFYPYGFLDAEGLTEADDAPDEDLERGVVHGLGRHRKWVGNLTRDEWLACAERLCIDLDDEGMPIDYDATMGALTVIDGHPMRLPAVSIDNTEGWTPTRVIDSRIYMSVLVPERSEK